MATKGEDGGGLEALHSLKATEPPLFLTPSSDLSFSSRAASEFLFSSLKPYTPKSPFDQLLTNGFDAEQIWQQIDLQSQPLISSLHREIKRFEKEPSQISKGFDAFVGKVGSGVESAGRVADMEQDDDIGSEELEDEDDDEEQEEEEEEEEKEGDLEESGEDDEMKEDAMEEDSEDNESEEDNKEIEDKFLKIKELEKYLKEDEEREYGMKTEPKKAGVNKTSKEDLDDDEEDEEDEDEDEDDQLGLFEEGDEDDELDNARYEDFYVSNDKNSKKDSKKDTKKDFKKKHKQIDESDDSDAEDEQEDNEREKKLSRHEIEQKKLQAKIEEMEKANMDPKTWTMRGEVTAAKRPLNSALEADLDFDHNVRPPPVITEEVTESIEEIIKKRIVEGRFDGVQRAPKLPSKAPREKKELDEHKSKKGLADIYEEEYLEKTGLAPASLSFSDELKKEASMLFKRLTLKLNALSHFHFAPKPVVEDMAVETNLPALAMEEVAPVAVSDAAMLAPEEVFAGAGVLKEEAELTQGERKRRRAKKKRKYKAEETKRMAKKPREAPVITQGEGKVAVIKA